LLDCGAKGTTWLSDCKWWFYNRQLMDPLAWACFLISLIQKSLRWMHMIWSCNGQPFEHIEW
jgi:hypothetical protein